MNTNLIRPENEHFRTFYASHIAFCGGNACAAGLLEMFDRFHTYKLEQRKSNRKYNDIAQQHGEARTQYEWLYQSHTQKDLVKYLMGIFSINIVRASLKLLIDKGIVTVHSNPDPRFRFDKTNYYLFHPEVFNDWVKANWSEEGSPGSGQNNVEEQTPDEQTECNSEMTNFNKLADHVKEEHITFQNEASTEKSTPDSRNAILHSRCHRFVESIPQKQHLRGHSSDDAIYNIDLFNKENNLNLTSVPEKQNKHAGSEQTSGLVSGSFFENKKTGNEAKQQAPSAEATSKVLWFGSIGDKLTSEQEAELQQRFQVLQEKLQGRISVPTELLNEIKYTLLDKTALTQCENNFHRKLTCIENLILKNQWRTPYAFSKQISKDSGAQAQQEKSALDKKLSQLDERIRLLGQDIYGDEKFLEMMPFNEKNETFKQTLIKQNQDRREKVQLLLLEKRKLLDEQNTDLSEQTQIKIFPTIINKQPTAVELTQ